MTNGQILILYEAEENPPDGKGGKLVPYIGYHVQHKFDTMYSRYQKFVEKERMDYNNRGEIRHIEPSHCQLDNNL